MEGFGARQIQLGNIQGLINIQLYWKQHTTRVKKDDQPIKCLQNTIVKQTRGLQDLTNIPTSNLYKRHPT